MADNHNFLLNLSVLYRNVQKYFDHVLAPYEIGSGQVIILMVINENTGITMQEVSSLCEIDKGTCTKSVNRLIEQEYVQVRQDEKDRRIKRLYTTDKAEDIINHLYEYRNACRTRLAYDNDFSMFETLLENICDNSRNRLNSEEEISSIRIGGFTPLTLNGYPGHISACVHTAGCPWKCPFCNQRSLVYIPEDAQYVDPDEVLGYLKKRKGILDGVVITGGEPLMQKDLKPFLKKIHRYGYQIRLETSGCRPQLLMEYCEAGLIDQVSMDIKNRPEKYGETAGMDAHTFSLSGVQESIRYLKSSSIPSEFTTTVVKEFHTIEDLIAIAEWIGPVDHYVLQTFETSGDLVNPYLQGYTEKEMEEMLEEVRKIIPSATLRKAGR